MGVTEVVIGVDGGNSKTDVAVADTTGQVLALVHGPGSSPDKLGTARAVAVIDDLIKRALSYPSVPVGVKSSAIGAFLAGLDLPEDAPAAQALLQAQYPDIQLVVDNDTTAVLMAGTRGAPGVAVVCGAGINAAGQSPSGQRVGFLSLGQISGDWGGGLTLGREALWSAVRSEDGRGERTVLETAVCAHFGVSTPIDLALAIHRGEIAAGRVVELVPAVFSADTDGDPVARRIIERLGNEIAGMARILLERSGLAHQPAPVVLAGGVLTSGHERLVHIIVDALALAAPYATIEMLRCRPVTGAILSALGALPGATASGMEYAGHRLTAALGLTPTA